MCCRGCLKIAPALDTLALSPSSGLWLQGCYRFSHGAESPFSEGLGNLFRPRLDMHYLARRRNSISSCLLLLFVSCRTEEQRGLSADAASACSKFSKQPFVTAARSYRLCTELRFVSDILYYRSVTHAEVYHTYRSCIIYLFIYYYNFFSLPYLQRTQGRTQPYPDLWLRPCYYRTTWWSR